MEQELASLLSHHGKLQADQLQRARLIQTQSGERLGPLLVQLGLVAERDLAQVLAEHLDLEVVEAAAYPDTPVVDVEVSAEFLRTAKLVPLDESEDGVVVAMADPLDTDTRDALQLAFGRPVVPKVGLISDIESAIHRLFGEGNSHLTQIVDGMDGGGDVDPDDIQQLRDLASEAPIIRLVNLIISRALKASASDIHIEPFANRLKVRYRVDGVLREVDSPPVRSTAAVISRIKVMANLNIAERRLPQDGRIKLRIEGRDIDLRISTVPTMDGESVVMRILDKGSVPLDFATLGFFDDDLARFDTLLNRPHGIILVTGPTGSGKTTTLYTALQKLNTPDKKLLTVEDPVEYQLEGINQIQIKPQIGLSFAGALRSILRQDPDVIMVGEMRDLETAKIAVQAALTGHKVFSTLHTNDAAGSITRLLDMGIEDYLVTSTVNGLVAQRLVRVLCQECKEAYYPLPEMVSELRLTRFGSASEIKLHRPVGCDACDGIGFRGRATILELLVMSEGISQVILNQGEERAIRHQANQENMMTMYEDGLRKVVAGITTLEEVERVTREA